MKFILFKFIVDSFRDFVLDAEIWTADIVNVIGFEKKSKIAVHIKTDVDEVNKS